MAVVDVDHTPEAAQPVPGPGAGWEARLRLRFAAPDGRTRIVEREHRGPLVVQRPFYPEGDAICHAYVVHPPGGIVGGDSLTLRVDVTDGGQALITTPAAAKLYRSSGALAHIDQKLTVSDSSSLEWLPQETIAFDRSLSDIRTRIVLEEGARFVGWDILSFGRPAAGEAFVEGRLRQRLEIRRAGAPLLDELLSMVGGGPEFEARWGLGGHDTTATLVAAHPEAIDDGLLARVRASLAPQPVHVAASVVSGALVVRLLSDGTRQALDVFMETWSLIRPALLGRPAETPRIWAT